MVSMRDVEKIALAMPGATKELRDDDRPAFLVDHKLFCFHRTKRRDALDPATGEPLDDVLVFRVADEEMKSMWLALGPRSTSRPITSRATRRSSCAFPSLAEIDREELFELVSDAWLARAPKQAGHEWLADQGLEADSE